MDQIIVGVTVIGLVGLALNASAGRLEKSLLNWRGKSTATY
jgi:sulfonate transport system permease protein